MRQIVKGLRSTARGLCLSTFVIVAAPALAQETPTITVVGSGSVAVVPDKLIVTSRVITQDKSAETALEENSRKLELVIQNIKDAGIKDNQIQTRGFGIRPIYENLRNQKNTNQAPSIISYRVTNGVEITIDSVEKLGSLLPNMVKSGANNVSDIRFIVSDQSNKLDEARSKAVADAMRKATLYAQAVGGTLGSVLSIDEQGNPYRPGPRTYEMSKAVSSAPMAAGEETLSTTVTLKVLLEQ
ncbi:SIMPL domain-containing protein [Flexibacterium corallicola]|uniref:SIMPL domain-containing protein n=1 Tax=Flexibacterium corallicola TaxID=3037259 RepID=UPI00286F2A89|nr:SIMPL domain-containing protein [Pseudovibrio sp. M1P-2-3]